MQRKMRLVLTLLVISSFLLPGYASEQDSLKHLLEEAQTDSAKGHILYKLADKLYSSKPDSALNYARQALEKAKSLGVKKLEAKTLATMGNIFDEKGALLQSLEYNQQALEIFRNLAMNARIGLTLNNIGIVYYKLGDYPKAIDMLHRALDIRKNYTDSTEVAKTLNNIAMVHMERNKYDKALEVYQQALSIKKKHADAWSLAAGYNNIGNVYNRKKNYEKARQTFDIAYQLYDSLDSDYGRAAVLNNLGLVYESQEAYARAKTHYRRAYQIYRKTGYKAGRTITLNNIANSLTLLEQFRDALPYAQKSYKLAREMHSSNDIKNATELLATIHEALGAYKKALEYHQLFKQYSDSLLNESNIKEITTLEMQYEFDKKQQKMALERQQEEALHQEAMKRQRLIQYALGGGLFLLLILAFLIYRNYRTKAKSNKKLLEKNAMITQQNEEIKTQADYLANANEEITLQKESLQEKNQQITASIEYARRIQTALLRGEGLLEENLADHFILWKPRDIVSGDFYWIREINNHLLIVAADCTGHGVPGALMSMLGIAFLNEITRSSPAEAPNQTLEQLRQQVKDALIQNEQSEQRSEGIDMGFCSINLDTNQMQYAGAFNPLYLIRNGSLQIFKATRNPIGTHMVERPFAEHTIQLQKGDRFYMFSDGVPDQIGGEKGFKFKNAQLRNILLNTAGRPMTTQKAMLEEKITGWMGTAYKQIDDILVLGGEIK